MNEFSLAFQALTPGTGVWALVALLALTIVKGWPKLREIQTGADTSLRHDLLAEVKRLRDEVKSGHEEAACERRICDAKIDTIKEDHRKHLADIGARHDRKVASLEDQIKGIENQMRQLVASLARGMNAPTAISTTLNRAYPIPGDMQDKLDKLDE